MNIQFRPELGPLRQLPTSSAPAPAANQAPVAEPALPQDQIQLRPQLTAPPILIESPVAAPSAPVQVGSTLQAVPTTLLAEPQLTGEPAPALSIASTLEPQFPTLAKIVNKLAADTAHPMNLVAYLKDPERKAAVLSELARMASLPVHTPDSLKTVVEESNHPKIELFNSDDAQFSQELGQKKSVLLRGTLQAQDPVLWTVGDTPGAGQMEKLEAHASKLRTRTLPALYVKLEGCLKGIPQQDGFPAVNARAKSAAGMVDKIHRMRQGNDGKAPRPEYSLADMPDAVGGRITVRDVSQLGPVMQALEKTFGAENIVEKDNFYSNPNKRDKPYRCITYTVLQDGVPCEVQLTTLSSSVAADLWHNTGYKKLHPDLHDSEIQQMGGLQRAVTADEHSQLRAALQE